jgi:hypothetical protein
MLTSQEAVIFIKEVRVRVKVRVRVRVLGCVDLSGSSELHKRG